jgi:hypothetical protein
MLGVVHSHDRNSLRSAARLGLDDVPLLAPPSRQLVGIMSIDQCRDDLLVLHRMDVKSLSVFSIEITAPTG